MGIREIAQQLTDIYFKEETWHKERMTPEMAYIYHYNRLEKGDIYSVIKDDKVVGYYERYLIGDTCFLHNVFVKTEYRHNGVFKELYKHFFTTMPKDITKVVGEQVKLGGKVITRRIYGKH